MSFEELDERFRAGLRNTEKECDSFMVLFTGVPFSGKSTVARVLQHRYGMVRIENDRLRELANDLGMDVDVYEYVMDFLENYSYPNKRIVQDSSIDRMYDELIPFCKEEGIPFFVISMPVPEDLDARAKEKGGMYWDRWQSSTDAEFVEDHEEVLEQVEIDFRFGEDGGMKELLDSLDEVFQ